MRHRRWRNMLRRLLLLTLLSTSAFSRPSDVVVESEDVEGLEAQQRDYSYHAGETNQGRPVYYVVEDEPESGLHEDRSPYYYEPADSHTSLSQQGYGGYPNPQPHHHPHAEQQPQDNWVIKQQTYQMCPGCPSFNIPIPIPKASFDQPQEYYDQQQAAGNDIGGGYQSYSPHQPQNNEDEDVGFLQRISNSVISTMQSLQNSALALFDPVIKAKEIYIDGKDPEQEGEANVISEKFDSYPPQYGQQQQQPHQVEKQGEEQNPVLIAGLAAMAVGGVALLSSAINVARFGAASGTSVDTKRSNDDDCAVFNLCKGIESWGKRSEALERL